MADGPFKTPDMGRKGEEFARLVQEEASNAQVAQLVGAGKAAERAQNAGIGKALSGVGDAVVGVVEESRFQGVVGQIEDLEKNVFPQIQAEQDAELAKFEGTTGEFNAAIEQGRLSRKQATLLLQQDFNRLPSGKARQAAAIAKQRLGFDPSRGAFSGSSGGGVGEESQSIKDQRRMNTAVQDMSKNPEMAHFVHVEPGDGPMSQRVSTQKTLLNIQAHSRASQAIKTQDIQDTQALKSSVDTEIKSQTQVFNNTVERLKGALSGTSPGLVMQLPDGTSRLVTGEEEAAVIKNTFETQATEDIADKRRERIRFANNKNGQNVIDSQIASMEADVAIIKNMSSAELATLSASNESLKGKNQLETAKIDSENLKDSREIIKTQRLMKGTDPASFAKMASIVSVNLAAKVNAGIATPAEQRKFQEYDKQGYVASTVSVQHARDELKPIAQEAPADQPFRLNAQESFLDNFDATKPFSQEEDGFNRGDEAGVDLHQVSEHGSDTSITMPVTERVKLNKSLGNPGLPVLLRQKDPATQKQVSGQVIESAAGLLGRSFSKFNMQELKSRNTKITISNSTGLASTTFDERDVAGQAGLKGTQGAKDMKLMNEILNTSSRVLFNFSEFHEGLKGKSRSVILQEYLEALGYPKELIKVVD